MVNMPDEDYIDEIISQIDSIIDDIDDTLA